MKPLAFLGGLSVLSLAFGLPLPANPPPNPPPTTPPAKTDIGRSVVLRRLGPTRPIGPYNLGSQIDPFPSLELANGEKKELTIFRFTAHFRINGYAEAVARMLGSASQPDKVEHNREQLDKFWAIMAEFAYHQVVSFADDFRKGGGIGRKLYAPPGTVMLKRTGPNEFVAGSSARAPGVLPRDLNAFSRQGKTGVFMEKCLEGTTKTGHDKNGLCGEQTAFGSEADLSTWKPPVPLSQCTPCRPTPHDRPLCTLRSTPTLLHSTANFYLYSSNLDARYS
ncbi:hypothetical protein GGTG_11684 [Gaeumannomyces tritici R3-111a-1]|uniref:Uncharacterized protein n=1 Tax=Gaeumannomyces tritici (strain R3-111a-1) TaxID=644352 RepID=J3PDW1_GAET3|nr:hypothetical protein GGTG_11684 [Gaeumannomyces tritici R3-111a-1]EJT70661.1 hypothetical protein GGTG_11684 [Gaeumannomyces tritici R3-111a-1]